jgi:hypothetical protein
MNEIKLPEVKFNKNGYEIRTEILAIAKDLVKSDFDAKWNGWAMSIQKDTATGQFVTTVGMPQFPGIDAVLALAERMYSFVSQDKRPK